MSNSKTVLSDLATQINAAHEDARTAARTAVERAAAAGQLLLEAKQMVPHGGWKQWLADHCTVAERTAQAYMRLARKLPELDASKAQRVADMPLREAFGAIADAPEPQPSPTPNSDGEYDLEELMEWAGEHLNAPFSMEDLDTFGWSFIRTKLLHQVDVPLVAALALTPETDERGHLVRPAIDFAQYVTPQDWADTLKKLAPVAKGEKGAVGFDMSGLSPRDAQCLLAIVEVAAVHTAGKCLSALKQLEQGEA